MRGHVLVAVGGCVGSLTLTERQTGRQREERKNRKEKNTHNTTRYLFIQESHWSSTGRERQNTSRVDTTHPWGAVDGPCARAGGVADRGGGLWTTRPCIGRQRKRWRCNKHKRDENTQNNNYPIHSLFIFYFFQFLIINT